MYHLKNSLFFIAYSNCLLSGSVGSEGVINSELQFKTHSTDRTFQFIMFHIHQYSSTVIQKKEDSKWDICFYTNRA